MKAKEYADMYHQRLQETNDCKRAISDMFIAFVSESGDVITQRGVKTTAGLLGVIREFDDKWRAIARLTDFNPDGFMWWVQKELPDVYQAMQLEKVKRGVK